ncbi:54S ribosomal protein yml6, mitochondrial [Dipsacomyces acuminosporus]|nr:54S ribosomal protein yml6, mitochondrial [Dipsacomyces acuminosporus]
MNRKLLDPFEPEYPESIEACLDDEYATKCVFSHHGSLLATARSDGQCYIWDMDTLNVARRLEHGEASLAGVSWSRNSRYILTFDELGVCILWDLQDGSVRARVEFDSAISCARVHPRNASQFIVCPAREAPCLVSVSADRAAPPEIAPIKLAGDAVDLKTKAASSTCCCFGKKGAYAFFGTSKGQVFAVHVKTMSVVCSAKLSASGVNTIAQNQRGLDIVTNSSDRIVRVCQVSLPANPENAQIDDGEKPSITVVTKIQDIVNRVHWCQAAFSSSGDYIVSGIEHKAEHNIYIWDKFTGRLVKVLTGPNEPIGSDRKVAPSAGEISTLNWPPVQSVRAANPFADTVQAWMMDFETNTPLDILDVQRSVFAAPIRTDIIHRVVTYERNMKRQGTHNSRTRSEVRGSTRKVSPQKGLGMARHGTRRAPQFVGGAKAHGPVPRSHETQIQRKVWLMGLRSVLSAKYAQDQLVIVDNMEIGSHRTRDLSRMLQVNGWAPLASTGQPASVMLLPYMESENPDELKNLHLASHNIPGVTITSAGDAEVYEILRHDYLILDRKALDAFETVLKPM